MIQEIIEVKPKKQCVKPSKKGKKNPNIFNYPNKLYVQNKHNELNSKITKQEESICCDWQWLASY